MNIKKVVLSTAVAVVFTGSTLLGGCGCGKPKPKISPRDIATAVLALEHAIEQKIEAEIALEQAIEEEMEAELVDEYTDVQDNRCYDPCANAVNREAAQAKKCCKKLHEELNEVEELLETEIVATQNCCSVVDTIGSLVDVQSGQIAVCCATTNTTLGTLNETCDVIPLTSVDAAEFSVLKWLKSIYCLIDNINNCLECPPLGNLG